MPATQFALLAVLEQRPGAAQDQLTAWMAMEQSTLSRNLQGLMRKRWVSSAPASGSRLVGYETTAAGRTALKRARPGWQRAQSRIKRTLGSDWQALGRLLHKVSALAG